MGRRKEVMRNGKMKVDIRTHEFADLICNTSIEPTLRIFGRRIM